MTSLKQAIVTGAASGIGAATAQALSGLGMQVLGLDRFPCPNCAQSMIVDLADPLAVEDIAGHFNSEHIVLVNAAGLPGTHTPEDILAVNLLAPRALSARFLARAAPGAAIVHVSSGAGWIWRRDLEGLLPLLSLPDQTLKTAFCERAKDGQSAYELSKALLTLHAVSHSSKTWAKGVRINAVAPGGVETPMLAEFRRSMGAETLDWSVKAVGRHAVPEEIADVIVFLTSSAARWINGIELMIDGGLAAGAMTGAWEIAQ